ncbi:MAG: hypothetical protein WCJ92_04695 [Alphaproteobacteria bacterium]
MPKRIFISLDTDWCSAEILSDCLDIIDSLGIKVTWFVTNKIDALHERMKGNSKFDIGPHPNFLFGSSHGETEDKVIEHVLSMTPSFRLFRNHACYYNGKLLYKLRSVGALLDSSLFIPNCLHANPFRQYVTEEDYILRVPYTWSDYYFLLRSDEHNPITLIERSVNDVVFCLHPIHLSLNTKSISHYKSIQTGGECVDYHHNKKGIRDVFMEIVEHCYKHNIEICLLEVMLNEY